MSREYEPTDSGWMWDKIKSLMADNTRLFDENERLRKENQHMQARWDNWDNEQRKKVIKHVDRIYDAYQFPSVMRFDMSIAIDEAIYRHTNFDYALELAKEVHARITEDMKRKFSKQQEVTK